MHGLVGDRGRGVDGQSPVGDVDADIADPFDPLDVVATMLGANLGGRLIATMGAKRLGVGGMGIAAAGLLVPALWPTTPATVAGVSVGALGIGALFVVASATALGRIEPAEAGVASGLLSTFYEFGASIGVATVSSMAAASLVGGDGSGFQNAFLVAATAALAAAVVAGLTIPRSGRSAHPVPCGSAPDACLSGSVATH
ncbi:MFS transporter [Yimella lutea]|uniref:MFS transporter n=1 Tax=Yimella lutea TaxID=587872 RepID=A0A542EC14_9MICO|nr:MULTISPECIES: MFS transporter [Yimella]TQJ12873.1 MFS transporter [Yimella lutea]